MNQTLVNGFLESVMRFPQREALVVDHQHYTYSELSGLAARIALLIAQNDQDPHHPLAAILAHRSTTAYAGVLGILGAGRGYVPLNPKYPVLRTSSMLQAAGCNVVVVGRECHATLTNLLSTINQPLTVILPDVPSTDQFCKTFPQHSFFSCPGNSPSDFQLHSGAAATDIAYLLFTSGSTGRPKGVPISHENVSSYLQFIRQTYHICERDRFSQTFDLTFDLSIHDMFLCWGHGACLFCLPESSAMLPAKFIREHGLTFWFSVPSVIGILSKMRLLQPGSFPSLRYSLFCGEPLPASYAYLFQEAAPNSIVENLYGPTETTIAISCYRWNQSESPKDSQNGITPIGWVFPAQQCHIVNDALHDVKPSEIGELCLSGSQVSRGYWNEPHKTSERFVRLPNGGDAVWYRTGDLVRQDEKGCLHFCGRTDEQVKVRGYRVELQEIDAVLRQICGSEQVASIPLQTGYDTPTGIVGFVCGSRQFQEHMVLARCRETLPEYMVPSRIVFITEMPLNANGKIDRGSLGRLFCHEPL